MTKTQDDLLSKLDQVSLQFSNRISMQVKSGNQYKKITYQALKSLRDQYTETLKNRGLLPGAKVAILSEASPEAIISLLAILANHCTVVLLDPSLPEATLAELIHNSGSSLLLVSDQYEKKVVANEKVKVPYFLIDHELKSNVTSLATMPIQPETSIAIIIFTSGTGGINQGVMIDHASLLYQLEVITHTINLKHTDAIFFMLPLNHIAPLMAILVCLYTGAMVHFVPKLDSQLLLEQLPEVKPTIFPTVPRVIELIDSMIMRKIATLSPMKIRIINVLRKLNFISRKYLKINLGRKLFKNIHTFFGNNLRFILAGSAPLNYETQLRFEQFGLPILFGYGLTETTNIVTMTSLNCFEQIGSVGKPLRGMQMKISNPNEKGIGEILLNTPCLMKGYLNNIEATQKAIKDNWLYTGDMGYLDAKGNLHISGRIKEIIVTEGGKKVAPQFIESQYGALEGASEYAVFGVPVKNKGSDVIYVAIVIDPEYKKSHPQAEEKIKEAVNKKSSALSHHLRIQRFHFVEALPKTSTLKIKRMELRKQILENNGQDNTQSKTTSPAADNTSLPPKHNALKTFIRQHIHHAFHQEANAIPDQQSFFELGMDSLMMTDLLQQIQQHINNEMVLPVTVIIDNPSIEKLANAVYHLLEHKSDHPVYLLPPLTKLAKGNTHPVSLQQRYWLERQKQADLSTGYISFNFTIKGDIDFLRFKQAIEEIVKQQEILRTTFLEENANFYQKVGSNINIALEYKDLSQEVEEQHAIDAFVTHCLSKKADYKNGPLGGCFLMKLKNNRSAVLIAFHHLIFDGLSVWVFLNLVKKYYHENTKTLPNDIQYADFALWQYKAYQGDILNYYKQYWETLLLNSKPFTFPHNQESDLYTAKTICYNLTASKDKVERGATKNKVNLFTYYYMAFLLTAMQQTKQNDITVSIPQSGRFAQELNALVGFFASTCLSRTQLNPSDTLEKAFAKLEMHLASQKEFYIPYQLVKELLAKSAANLSYHILFSYMKPAVDNVNLLGFPLEKIHESNQPFQHDMLWYLFEYDKTVSLYCTYNAKKYTEEHVLSILRSYEKMLATIAEKECKKIEDL